jgi:UDP-N-acetylglucosamine 2-epimerase (non-hydrolysing)
MAKILKLLLVAGARPNFMKVAPIIRRVRAHEAGPLSKSVRIEVQLVHTGQHYDNSMSGVFFRELGIPEPDVNLEVGSGSHAAQTASIMTRFEPVCLEQKPDWVVVVGDVNSTMACTLVCAKLGIRVAHVEAGLRSYDRTMPEEINRIVTDALADLLLTPSSDADENLKKEGIPACRIKLVGNVMIDTLVANLDKARASRILSDLAVQPKGFVYVTLHRPSNVDDRNILAAIISELKRLAAQVPVVFPIHPRTRKMCEQFGIALNGEPDMKVIEPIGYHDSLCLTEAARLVLTDSGGLQEESTYFRTPCLTLRPNTERPITVTIGSNKLTEVGRLPGDFREALGRELEVGEVPPLWDGHASERIIKALVVGRASVPQPEVAPATPLNSSLATAGRSE